MTYNIANTKDAKFIPSNKVIQPQTECITERKQSGISINGKFTNKFSEADESAMYMF